MAAQKRRWQGLSATTRHLLALSPDEHAFLDFKQNISPLTDTYMAAMANAAALAGEPHATVLVGVAEEKDARTGVTSGRLVGVDGDAHKAGETIAQRTSQIGPTPVAVVIFEENVRSKPILRVVISPTAPPHYDQAGRRATRQHTTTRAMSDAEILELLEARERRRYAGVAEETANLMMGDFRVVTDEVLASVEDQQQASADDVTSAIREVTESVAEDLIEGIREVLMRIDDLDGQLANLPENIDPGDPVSMEHTLRALVSARQMGFLCLSFRINELVDADIEAIERVVSTPLDPLAYVRNCGELRAWNDLQAIAFEDDSDIAAAARAVVAARESGERPAAISLRALAEKHPRLRAGKDAPQERSAD